MSDQLEKIAQYFRDHETEIDDKLTKYALQIQNINILTKEEWNREFDV